MGDIFLSGQNQCLITGVKKSYFCHTFHLRPKKVFWWVGGGGWKVTLLSVCVHFLKLLDNRHTDTEMDTELDNFLQNAPPNLWRSSFQLWSQFIINNIFTWQRKYSPISLSELNGWIAKIFQSDTISPPINIILLTLPATKLIFFGLNNK